MKNKISFRILASATAMIATFGSLAPLDASARQRSGHVAGPRNGTVDRTITRTPGQVEKSGTYTSPTGKVSTREASRTIDPATGNVSASSTTTLANGKTASRNLASEKTETGRTTTAQKTGFNGKTSTYDSTTTRTDNGFTREATTTGPNGGTVAKDITVTKQDGTVTRTATTTTTPPAKP